MGEMIRRGEWFEMDRTFSVWAYTVSFCQLLLRSPKDGRETRVDVGFSGVRGMVLPPRFGSLVIRPVDEDELARVCELLDLDEVSVDEAWAVGEFEQPGFVVAQTVSWHEDDDEFFQPSPVFLPSGPFSGLVREDAWEVPHSMRQLPAGG